MLTVEDWAEIRRLHRAEDLPIKQIARVLGISRNTVRAALASDGRGRVRTEGRPAAAAYGGPRQADGARRHPARGGRCARLRTAGRWRAREGQIAPGPRLPALRQAGRPARRGGPGQVLQPGQPPGHARHIPFRGPGRQCPLARPLRPGAARGDGVRQAGRGLCCRWPPRCGGRWDDGCARAAGASGSARPADQGPAREPDAVSGSRDRGGGSGGRPLRMGPHRPGNTRGI